MLCLRKSLQLSLFGDLPLSWLRVVLALVLSSSLLFASGCGSSATVDRYAVNGAVTLDGEPLSTGAITFFPDTEGAVASGGTIQNGEFVIAKEQGLPAGTYKVSITSTVSTAPASADPNELMENPPEVKSLVPTRYNSETTLTAEVYDTAENFLSFDLNSK